MFILSIGLRCLTAGVASLVYLALFILLCANSFITTVLCGVYTFKLENMFSRITRLLLTLTLSWHAYRSTLILLTDVTGNKLRQQERVAKLDIVI